MQNYFREFCDIFKTYIIQKKKKNVENYIFHLTLKNKLNLYLIINLF